MAEGDRTGDDWQVRAKQRQRRMYLVIGGLFGLGLISGWLVGYFEDSERGLVAANSVPPEIAIITTALFLVAVSFGTWRYFMASDELERRININATVMAGNILLIAFPAWFLLWKGGLASEPSALWLFCAGFAASMLTYAWQKLR